MAAGVHRIEALTGEGAILHVQHERERFGRILEALQVGDDQALDAECGAAGGGQAPRQGDSGPPDEACRRRHGGAHGTRGGADHHIVGVEAVLRRVEDSTKRRCAILPTH